MSDGAGLGLVERGRDAAARRDWQRAFDLVMGDGCGRPADPPRSVQPRSTAPAATVAAVLRRIDAGPWLSLRGRRPG